jgi:predicted LPLAT superfamily acyltransferase
VLRLPFLQGEALFPEGPFLIATKLQVPIAFYFAMREKGRRYRFYFRVIQTDRQVTTQELCHMYVQTLEKIVRHYPDQWFNFYKFWL